MPARLLVGWPGGIREQRLGIGSGVEGGEARRVSRVRVDIRVKCSATVRLNLLISFTELDVVVFDSLSWRTVPVTTESGILRIRCFTGSLS
jgi:hypothetical protein